MWAPSKHRGAIDFEAWEWVNPRFLGLLWGPPGAREWRSIFDRESTNPKEVAKQGLRLLLAVAESGGPWEWWAHNGGRYDDCFFLEACIEMGWEVQGHVAAGRLITMTVKAPGADHLLRFYDSQAVINAPLRDVATDFELQARKLLTKDDYSVDVRKWSPQRIEDGCRTDCELVLQALERVEAMLEEWGGGLRATFSAASLSVLEAKCPDLPDMRKHRLFNSLARLAYCGGRVEVLHHMPWGWLTELDVNSSYPWSMTQKLPLHPRRFARNSKEIEAVIRGERTMGVVNATVTVPHSMEFPPLPFLHPDGGMYFPRGTWRAWFASSELNYARELGCQVKAHQAIGYTAEAPFEEFVNTLYETKSKSTGAKKTFTKFLLNGCYGKFGQRPERENLRVFAEETEAFLWAVEKAPNTVRPLSRFDERFWSEATERWPKRTHYALAANVTAHSRILLHKGMLKATRLAYVDTDSLHCESYAGETSAALGALKTEVKKMKAKFYAPKLYELHAETAEFTHKRKDGTKVKTRHHFASKGFPVTAKDFRRAVKSGEDGSSLRVRVERMRLAKSQLRRGGEAARDTFYKRWAGLSMKRCPFPDGSTEAWSVQDLLSGMHLKARSPLTYK